MISTNPRNFRAELKTHLDHANHEPVRIVRRSKESYILLNESHLSKLRDQVTELQHRLLESMEELAMLKSGS